LPPTALSVKNIDDLDELEKEFAPATS